MITRLEDAPLYVMEIKIGAGPIGEMFMNVSEEVKIKTKNIMLTSQLHPIRFLKVKSPTSRSRTTGVDHTAES